MASPILDLDNGWKARTTWWGNEAGSWQRVTYFRRRTPEAYGLYSELTAHATALALRAAGTNYDLSDEATAYAVSIGAISP